jgi:hypothetical protein
VAGAFDATKKIRDEYTKHVTATSHLPRRRQRRCGEEHRGGDADREFARAGDHHDRREFAASAPNIEWTSYVSAAKLASNDPISV